ncbi:low molecular weight protein-tyrosine-phosphatase [Pseudobacteriovorax antillogorgiicola]|uniref:protein-tyrosine-phosphatase n=1 Tax=Pseudobacteriovorax antillogorgiicola TaxID=1513793 RepID=A0A1Y6B9K6_9BACT|nr:low molecular weight protein-tyrosine-phosphatase [Pseudobacteriovorax antillogorgiicola]TCS58648.1 protein-tyrosine phosphatase [Pseudobacteriovorax antillogorgiicola]SME96425.1 protein-tyrosine phosphatase [Pseudobacteriovorax antillogorgiicola]
MNVLCVCLGNICRSPAAETILRHLAEQDQIPLTIDSAGTSAYHQGEPADQRMIEALERHGYHSISRSRQVIAQDFHKFDVIFAMDRSNLNNLAAICPDESLKDKLHLFCEFSLGEDREVPDPYFGGLEGFEAVIRLVEDASRGALQKIKNLPADS